MAKGKKPKPAKGHAWVNPGDPTGTPKKPTYNGNMLGELNLPAGYGDYVGSIIAANAAKNPMVAPGIGGIIGPKPGPPPAPPKFDGYAPDSVYNDTLASIAARRQMALNAATEGERSLSNDYGLGINQDASGATYAGQWAASDPNQLGIDPSNPFSRASLLNKSYFVAGKVGEGSYANRGLLTSGAYQRNQNRDAFRFEGGKDSLLKSFASQLQDYRQRRAQADADARSGQSQASYDLFNRRRDEYDRMYPS